MLDGRAALSDLLVSRQAVQDFCRITATRLPEAALGADHRSAWLGARCLAPEDRLPTEDELSRARELYGRRDEARRERDKRRASAARSLSSVRGWAVGDSFSVGKSSESDAGARHPGPTAGFSLGPATAKESNGGAAQGGQNAPRVTQHEPTATGSTSNSTTRAVSRCELDRWYKKYVDDYQDNENSSERDARQGSRGQGFPQ